MRSEVGAMARGPGGAEEAEKARRKRCVGPRMAAVTRQGPASWPGLDSSEALCGDRKFVFSRNRMA